MHCNLVGYAAAPTESDRPDLAVAPAVLAEILRRRHAICRYIRYFQLVEQVAYFVVVRRCASERREEVWREREESFDGETAGDILYMRIEPAVLVNYHDPWKLPLRVRRRCEVTRNVATAAVKAHFLGRHPLVVGGHNRGLRAVGGNQRRDRGR